VRAIAQARDAGICRRLAALVLDLCIAAAVLAFAALVLHKSGLAGALSGDLDAPSALWRAHRAWLFAGGALALATVVCWHALGGTPGGLLLGVSVRRAADGARADYAVAAARLLLALVLAGIGLLWSFKGRPALYDRLTGTRAVLEDEVLYTLDDFAGPDA
jgi:hypothetical protein